jgi:hypothetical protein
MLMHIGGEETARVRNHRRERRLWHDPTLRVRSLGCAQCPERIVCGGLEIQLPILDCLDFCCRQPARCDRVCRNHPDYAGHVREIATFALGNIPRSAPLVAPALPQVVPVLFHGGGRSRSAPFKVVALPFSRMFSRREGSCRHSDREALRAAYGIQPGSVIVLSGTDRDAPLERWWGFGESKRRELIRNFRQIGVALTTSPNYSLFIDAPRWDDLHAMKRIAIVHHEFQSEGLEAALHVNGRTDTDFRRWTEFVAARPEITHLAYELTTGTGWAGRQQLHAAWLCALAAEVNRPLTLVLRGGIDVLAELTRAFAHVTLLDTSSFIKTMMRQRASLNGRLDWLPAPTDPGTPIDDLLAENVDAVRTWIGSVVDSRNSR